MQVLITFLRSGRKFPLLFMTMKIIVLLFSIFTLQGPAMVGQNSSLEKTAENYLKIKDHHIYFEVAGNGNPIILIHGGYLDHSIWNSQVEYLNRHGYKTIIFDDLGHGSTVNGEEELYGYEIIEQLRSRLKLDKISLVGLSWGAMLAVDYSLKYPENVEKLVLISPGMNGWQYFKDPLAQQNYDLRQLAKKMNQKAMFVEYFQRNWSDGPGQPATRLRKPVRRYIEQIILQNVNEHWNESWSKLSNNTQINTITKKTLLITGQLDALDIHEIAKEYHQNIYNSQWTEIKNAAHTLVLEKPEKTNRLRGKFLKE